MEIFTLLLNISYREITIYAIKSNYKIMMNIISQLKLMDIKNQKN